MKSIIPFYNNLEDNNRLKSWEHCYTAFQNELLDMDSKALHLAFYLASWGMYRGSSVLLQKDYTIHIGAIKILQDQKYTCLQCKESQEVDIAHVDLILNLKNELKSHYKKHFNSIANGKEYKQERNASDTLITKIMLGTLACVPAYDRYFIDGLRAANKKGFSFNKQAIINLFQIIKEEESSIAEVQSQLNKKELYFPKMKIIDMYFWNLGFQLDK